MRSTIVFYKSAEQVNTAMAGAPGARSFILIKYRLDLSTLGALIGLLDLICAYAAQVCSLCASVAAVYLPFLVFGRVLTRLETRLD